MTASLQGVNPPLLTQPLFDMTLICESEKIAIRRQVQTDINEIKDTMISAYCHVLLDWIQPEYINLFDILGTPHELNECKWKKLKACRKNVLKTIDKNHVKTIMINFMNKFVDRDVHGAYIHDDLCCFCCEDVEWDVLYGMSPARYKDIVRDEVTSTFFAISQVIETIAEQEIAAIIIQRACHNWLYKPVCKDGSVGILPRLSMRELGIDCQN